MKMSSLYVSRVTLVCVAVCVLSLSARAADPVPGSPELPLQYIGPDLPDGEAPDGRLMYSPGVQNIQIDRANRKHPPNFPNDPENVKGWTYQHHVDIGCWKGKLYAVWDMTHKGEDNPPSHVVYSTSADGFQWSEPADLFPSDKAFNLRFYFYRASNGRMLAFAAGAYPTDNMSERDKTTLIVREITADHKLREVFTLIKPGPTCPPVYTESKDAGFVAACLEAYNYKPLLEQQDYGVLLGERRMKWHDAKNWPGGKLPEIGNSLWVFGKALCFYHRKDRTLVGVCKAGFVNLSQDEGETWSFPVIPKGIVAGGGKVWAQRTPDERFAMIYTPQSPGPRYPMVVTTSDDGITFRDMRVIHGEVPGQRYEGRAKDVGPQYLRGIAEWGGDAPGLDKNSIWTIYSMGKEDIWVSRIPVPIVAESKNPVNDTFENSAPGARVPGWNTYSLLWAPVRIAQDTAKKNRYLELEDREPTDYARAIRTFPVSKALDVSFRVAAAQTDRGRLEIELLGKEGSRPVRVVLNEQGRVEAIDGRRPTAESFSPGLSGTYFNKTNFEKPENEVDMLPSLDQNWGKSKGNDWSARWTGVIEGPYSGEVSFTAEATDGLRLKVGDKVVIDGLAKNGARSGTVVMKKGEKAPIVVEFVSLQGKAALKLLWAWQGQAQTLVPASAVSHKADAKITPVDLTAYKADGWLDFKVHADCAAGKYTVWVNGKEVLKDAAFAEPSPMVYALSFRTGEYRGKPTGQAKKDIPNSEEPAAGAVYRIDDVKVGR